MFGDLVNMPNQQNSLMRNSESYILNDTPPPHPGMVWYY